MTNMLSVNISMRDIVTSIIEKSTKNVVILVDSLSMYLLRTEFGKVYKEILDITSSDKGKCTHLLFYKSIILNILNIMLSKKYTGVSLQFIH